ncbi:hypothetical protein [Microbacterium rhizomatis]|uniref:Uncharacterized protein n=1 Tax=Microbacterium rhizomatis TaxID=1631477 RepID=A0A5J5J6C4_9MICO|nr:hypothetical protein [Microbacterium rhizomatis]KAA9110674.1 hypothetical protein F6B43_03195 [Microbacterium rhizomatis]
MSERLLFTDAHAAADALTFAGRCARLGDGAVRLQGANGTLAMTAAPLAPRGLMDATPTVLVLRAHPVDPELSCDLVVEASALHPASDDARAVVLPVTALSPAWAGIAPPRSGWAAGAGVPASELAARAQWGIAAVAEAMPSDPGEDLVRTVRAHVWGEPDAALGDLPRGAAFAAFAMGFIVGEETARVFTSGPWTRLTLDRGHVLVRGPVRVGLTAVRATGRG